MLLPHELGLLLQVTRQTVLRMIRRGEIRNASLDGWNRIAVEDAGAFIDARLARGACSPLAPLLLAEMASGALRVSKEEARWLTLEAALGRSGVGSPAPLHEASRT